MLTVARGAVPPGSAQDPGAGAVGPSHAHELAFSWGVHFEGFLNTQEGCWVPWFYPQM